MSEPPMSLQPQFSSCAARSGPIFTHDACMVHYQPRASKQANLLQRATHHGQVLFFEKASSCIPIVRLAAISLVW